MDLLKLIHKELRAEILNKEIIITMLSFGLSIIVIISFTSNLSKQIIEAYAPGLFLVDDIVCNSFRCTQILCL